MVAYSFQRRFVEPILGGTKGGTIRAPRKAVFGGRGGPARYRAAVSGGHALPGDEMQLYTGMRTKQSRLIAKFRCLEVAPIELLFVERAVLIGNGIKFLLRIDRTRWLDIFARFDGFADFDEMHAFWRNTRASRRPGEEGPEFSGWHIRWLPLPDFDDA